MKDVMETLQSLQNTPVPNLLVVGGLAFLLLAFVGKFGAFVTLPPKRQKWAGTIGILLLISGIGLFIVPPASRASTPEFVTPTASPTVALPTNTIELPDDDQVYPPTNTPTPIPPTVTPTIVPLTPTFTPVPVPQCEVNTNALNLRQGPNTQFDIIEQMPYGTLFVAQMRTIDTVWVFGYSHNGGSGWTSAGYLTCTYDLTKLPVAEILPPTYTPTSTSTSTPTPTNTPSPTFTHTPTLPSALPVEDCIGFNPDAIEVIEINGGWKIVEGSHWIMDFENNQTEARDAFRVITAYHLNETCFVGRPNPSMEYLLANGNPPSGAISGEDCIGFDPDAIEVTEINGRWKIVEGSHWIMDFENNQIEANMAYLILKYYNFNHICFVGRPNPSMTYFRR